jgi:hypothetical protein
MFRGPAIRPKCKCELELALPPGGKGRRFNQCFNCHRPDPLESEQTQAWLKGELAPKE